MEEIQTLIRKNRSYRRFDHFRRLNSNFLKKLVESARLSQSAANLQPLSYITVLEEKKLDEVFSTLGWAGYLKDWNGAEPSERPTGYIIVLAEKDNGYVQVDAGLAMQNISITAIAEGIGSCILANIKREQLADILEVDKDIKILYVVALGYPVENVQLTNIDEAHGHKYYRDNNGNHFVPKRSLSDILIKEL